MENGMTLRDWFAALADVDGFEFPGFDVAARVFDLTPPRPADSEDTVRFSLELDAALRYRMADAMLKEREKWAR